MIREIALAETPETAAIIGAVIVLAEEEAVELYIRPNPPVDTIAEFRAACEWPGGVVGGSICGVERGSEALGTITCELRKGHPPDYHAGISRDGELVVFGPGEPLKMYDTPSENLAIFFSR